MATIIRPLNNSVDTFSVFLSGSTENDPPNDWRTCIERALVSSNIAVLNPYRADWDSSWVCSIEKLQFREQVEWELAALETADLIAVYLSPGAKSSISLLELGLFARSGKVIVCCPEGFWRKGHVDIVCARYAIEQVSSIDTMALRIGNIASSKGAVESSGD